MPPAKDTEGTDEARDRRRMQNRMAQRRFRGRQRQQSTTLSQVSLDVLPPVGPGPDPLPTLEFSTLFDDACIDMNMDMQYLDPHTNTSLPTTTFTSPLQAPSSSSTSLSLPSVGDSGFMTQEDLEIIMTPSEKYLPGRDGLDPHDPEHTDSLRLLPNNLLESNKSRDIDAMIINNSSSSSSNRNGWLSILHLAVHKGHDNIIRVLLERKMDCNDPDSDGLTPLMHATIQGHERAVALLLSHGACAGKLDRHQRSVLHWAVLHRRETLLKIMLNRCAGYWRIIDGYDGTGRTPLHVAVEIGFDAGVEMLLQFGANLHHPVQKS